MPLYKKDGEKALYDYLGNSIPMWLMKVINLLVAARFIDNNVIKIKKRTKVPRKRTPITVSAIDPCYMLKGFSIECYFKSIWLMQGNKLAKNGEYKKIPRVGQHNLSALSAAIKINIFQKNEIRFLDTLTYYSTGPGRYPVGRNYKNKRPYIPQRHIKYFRDIVQKISNELLASQTLNKKHIPFIEEIIRLVS